MPTKQPRIVPVPAVIRPLLPLLLVAVLARCATPPDTMRTAATLPLADSTATTLSIDDQGALWIGTDTAVLRVAGEPPTIRRYGIGLAGLRWLGRGTRGPLFAAPEGLALWEESGDSAVVQRVRTDAAVLDVRGRWIFRTTASGEMIAHDPATLDPLWGWAEIGADSPALALSPEADRVYQSAGEMEFRDEPELLSRDLESGRVMTTGEMPGTVRALAAGNDGLTLWAVAWDGGGGEVLGIAWRNGGMEIAWSVSLGSLDLEPPVTLKLAPDERSLLVVDGNENGLRILDAEAGETVDRLRGPIRDADYSPDGEVFVLYEDRVDRVVGRISARPSPPSP